MTAPVFTPAGGMKRARYGEGSVTRVGRRVKKWLGYWFEYVMVDGREVRRKRKKIVGPGTMSKAEAKGELRKHLAARRPGMVAAAPDCSVAELWERYVAYKAAAWGKQNAEVMASIFRKHVIPEIGRTRASEVTIDPLQWLLMKMVQAKKSKSALQKVRTHLKAMFEYAVDIDLIQRNPARGKKLVIPRRGVKRSCERFYDIDEVRRLLTHSSGRDRIILRLLLVCGLRPGELFALRVRDIEPGQIMIDEAVKQRESGADLIGEPKTDGSVGYVAITESVEREIRQWVSCLADQSPDAWVFPSRSRSGSMTPIRPANYLKRVLKPLAEGEKIEIDDLTYQAMRRTCGTFFRKDLQSAKAQLRHSSAVTTSKHYMKTITADHRAAVEKIDAEFLGTEYQVSTRVRKAGSVND